MSVDISCKKIIKNDTDLIVFDDNDLEHVIFGILFTLVGLYVILNIPPSEKIEDWLLFKLGFSTFVIFGISAAFGKLETITIDRRIQSVYIESRRFFLVKGKERTIKFSEILYPSIKENNTTEPPPSWDIILTLKSGETKQIFRGENYQEAEALLDKICAFLRGDEVSSFISTSEGSTSEYSLHHRTLSLENGCEGKFNESNTPK